MRRFWIIAGMMGLTLGVCVAGVHASGQRDKADDPPRSIGRRLGDVIQPVEIDQAPARAALAWWSRTTAIPLVVQWKAIENQGIDPQTPITLHLSHAPAGQVLALMMRQLAAAAGAGRAAPGDELLYQTTPWYVQVLTKAQANRRPILRLYNVRDLVMTIPDFDDAPTFDLREALSNTNSGGGGNSGGGDSRGGLFGDQPRNPRDGPLRRQGPRAQGQALAEVVRQSIEPTLWKAHGGEVASIHYYQGKLIVRAPLYIQRQIGTPLPPIRRPHLSTEDASSDHQRRDTPR